MTPTAATGGRPTGGGTDEDDRLTVTDDDHTAMTRIRQLVGDLRTQIHDGIADYASMDARHCP
ncbi:hypothetical protein AB0F18_19020 [Streptomyces sp. NPDC029216]|uniref:hypothetical protein n=1 Tax=Streptomyces sp. NPDC029216 TaxID=3154701 RepID=UPI0033D9E6E7